MVTMNACFDTMRKIDHAWLPWSDIGGLTRSIQIGDFRPNTVGIVATDCTVLHL